MGAQVEGGLELIFLDQVPRFRIGTCLEAWLELLLWMIVGGPRHHVPLCTLLPSHPMDLAGEEGTVLRSAAWLGYAASWAHGLGWMGTVATARRC